MMLHGSNIEVGDEERLRLRDRPHDVPIMRQVWRRLAFMHWPVAPRVLAGLLPPSLDLDLWDGAAYVGLVPFSIRDARPSLFPAVPFLSSFHELNFRTYVHRRGRDPGVWFFSLDAASHAAVALARLAYKLPYHHARMNVTQGPDRTIRYSSTRDGGDGARFQAVFTPSGEMAMPARAATLPFFLIERYLLYSWDDRRLRTARVWHPPYELQSLNVESVDEDLTARKGLVLTGKPVAHYCHELDVRIYPPHLVREPTEGWAAEAGPQLA